MLNAFKGALDVCNVDGHAIFYYKLHVCMNHVVLAIDFGSILAPKVSNFDLISTYNQLNMLR